MFRSTVFSVAAVLSFLSGGTLFVVVVFLPTYL
jgi:hypothetical protein